jgi:hypothetical protein
MESESDKIEGALKEFEGDYDIDELRLMRIKYQRSSELERKSIKEIQILIRNIIGIWNFFYLDLSFVDFTSMRFQHHVPESCFHQ